MRVDIMTLFPDTVNAVLHESIIGRAAAKGILEINCVQIRDFTENRQKQVDDYPYGGGYGCVMNAQPLKSCLDHIMSTAQGKRSRVIFMSPQGQPYTQETAKRLKNDYNHLVLVCGHYEGIDERFIEACVDEEISLGDFVLTGGEIAAMAVADSVCRLVPGVLADEECYTGESHWDGLLEYPQYTRPEVWEGRRVPEVLIEGNHAKIVRWRRKQQILRTKLRRPDMFKRFKPQNDEDKKLIREVEKDMKRMPLTEPLSWRAAVAEDIPRIMEIIADAKASLAKFHVDQWQGPYPTAERFEEDIRLEQCYVVCHGGEVAGVLVLSLLEEPCYDGITDGKWTEGMAYTVIHRSAIGAAYRGTAMAAYMMQAAEEITKAAGRRCIRVDTHRKNKPMLNLLRDSGYRYRGNILVEECGHDPHRQAFEKILKDRK